MDKLPKPGERVIVRWAGGRVEAEVRYAWTGSRGGLVGVELLSSDPADPFTFTISLEFVERIPAA